MFQWLVDGAWVNPFSPVLLLGSLFATEFLLVTYADCGSSCHFRETMCETVAAYPRTRDLTRINAVRGPSVTLVPPN